MIVLNFETSSAMCLSVTNRWCDCVGDYKKDE